MRRQAASPLPTGRPMRLPASVLRRPRSSPVSQPPRSRSASRIGSQVRALRMAAGASGGGLAQSSGISASMLSRIERGLVSPSVETLERIAHGLGVPVSRFFGDQPSRTDFSHVPSGKGIRRYTRGPHTPPARAACISPAGNSSACRTQGLARPHARTGWTSGMAAQAARSTTVRNPHACCRTTRRVQFSFDVSDSRTWPTLTTEAPRSPSHGTPPDRPDRTADRFLSGRYGNA